QNKYTVTYVDGVDDEEIFADQVTEELTHGETTPAFMGEPARVGYTFTGWDVEPAETVTESVTYTATWTAIEYHITYVMDGTAPEGVDAPVDEAVYHYGDTYEVKEPFADVVIYDEKGEKAGEYNFDGWYIIDNTENETVAFSSVDGDVEEIEIVEIYEEELVVRGDITYTGTWTYFPAGNTEVPDEEPEEVIEEEETEEEETPELPSGNDEIPDEEEVIEEEETEESEEPTPAPSEEPAEEEATPAPTEAPSKAPSTPNTGDNFNMTMWILIMAGVIVVAVIAVVIYKKRK
ncbi:MAG: hypothetical protein Q4C42_10870, partial [Clostridia bacterium]|nr:hypothetical protein [Clostridia bacterium]